METVHLKRKDPSCIWNMEGLNRQETEDYVVDLYFNQKKKFREIQKLVRKSPRDIKAILDKAEPGQSTSPIHSRAYQMFDKGSSPIQVAIALNLRENQVREYYGEYWDLRGMFQLNQVYEELGNDIWSVMELHRRTKAEGLTPQQVSRILNRNITLERQNMDLEGEQARLEASKRQAAKDFQRLTDLKLKDHETLEKNDYAISQQKRELERLNIEKVRQENINLNNESRTKVTQIVKEEIKSIVPNPRRLLRIALASLFESSRKNPGQLHALYYNTPSHISVEQILSESSTIQSASRYHIGEIEDESLLLDEAEQLYNRIADAITNNCVNGIKDITS